MPIEEGLENDKPVEVKGIETATGLPKSEALDAGADRYDPVSQYKQPKSEGQKRLYDLAAMSGKGRSSVKGTSGLVSSSVNQLYEMADLAKAIPDYWERMQYIDQHGSKMQEIVNPDLVKIRFEDELLDAFKFREKEYHKYVKNFIDDLDENQGILEEGYNTLGKFLGKTTLSVTSVLPLIYGLGSSLINWDSSKIFDNSVFEAWDYMDKGLDENLVVYGGSDYWDYNAETGEYKQKEFFARFISDPIKSLNADVAPAASFVAGAVISEILASMAAPLTGGASVVGNTARLAAQSNRIFSKGVRSLRGLDKLDDAVEAQKLASLTSIYQKGLGTGVSAVRSAGYESALIGRSTQERTLAELVNQHREMKGREPNSYELAEYEKKAKSAGSTAFFTNIPLVAGSNMLQAPKLFLRNWNFARTGTKFIDNYKLSGTRVVNGKRIANVDANKALEYIGYGRRTVGRGIVEGWEEFAQGALEEGLIDYHTSLYRENEIPENVTLINSLKKAGRNYLNTVEGRDSVTIGALMGMLGMRVPFSIDPQTGQYRFSLKGQSFGGAFEGYRSVKSDIENARNLADRLYNQSPITNTILANNFTNFRRHSVYQKNMDDAAFEGNVKEFKDAEHDSLFSLVQTRYKNGIGDTVIQDIEAAGELKVDEFNKTYMTEGSEVKNYDEKQKIINKAKERVSSMLNILDEIQESTNTNKSYTDLIENLFKGKELKSIREEEFGQTVVDQLAYLKSASINANERIDSLNDELNKISSSPISFTEVDNLIAEIEGISKEGRVEFTENFKEAKNKLIEEWRKSNPNSFDKAKAEEIIDDIVSLKKRSAEAAKLYNSLYTKKGIETFAKFSDQLKELADERIQEELEKTLEEDVENAKNSNQVEQLSADETSVTGNNNILDEKVTEDVINGLEEIKKKEEQGLDNMPYEEYKNTILSTLNKHPKLLALVKEKLKDKFPIGSFKTIDEILDSDLDGTITASILNQVQVMLKSLDEYRANLNKPNPGEPTPNGANQDSFLSRVSADTAQKTKQSWFAKGKKVTALYTIVDTYDSSFDNKNEIVYGPDGKPKPHALRKASPQDLNAINAAEFLNNEMLEKENVEVELRIAEDRYSEDINDIKIEIIYTHPESNKEYVLGHLPAFKEGTHDIQLYKMRKAVVEAEQNQAEQESTTDGKELTKLQKDKQMLQAQLRNAIDEQDNTEEIREVREVLEDTKKDLEAYTIEGNKKLFGTEDQVMHSNKEGGNFIFHDLIEIDLESKTVKFKIEEAYNPEGLISELSFEEYDKKYLEKDRKEIENTIKELEDEIEKLQSPVTSQKVIDKIDNLKAEIAEINDKIRELGNKDIVDPQDSTSVELFNELDEIMELSEKERPAYLKELGEKYGVESVARAQAISDNFNNIVEQITSSGINIFFKDNVHKQCD
jgi:hypothetical protein